MKGFVEISRSECSYVAGGKDSEVARVVELIGYGIGALVRAIKNFRENRKKQSMQLIMI
ncbi:MAG: hypothetical protein IKZ50_00210 [Bacteroidales bacterium]|nr:hypothetical protein [Bacteroidales bacterium]MBR4980572.1 hypothetical protein [Bacteroidales bacterium]MBR5906800.1 hypothetical protein [Bacteroidales bacterium]